MKKQRKQRKQRKPVIVENNRDTTETLYHIFDERSFCYMTLNQFYGLCGNKGCEYNKTSWRDREQVVEEKIKPLINEYKQNSSKEYQINFLIGMISKHLLHYLCYNCENNTGKKPSEIKKECSRISKNLETITSSLKKLNGDPTFSEAIHVLLTDSDDISSDSYDKIEFNNRINEIEDTISILKKICSLKTGMEATKLKDRERENIFAWLMIIFKVITGKEPENEIKFSSSNNWKETTFYKLMCSVFKIFKIVVPAEMTAREYLIRFPFNDNDRGSFIQSCYEDYFGEHANKKKYINK
jgi:hypothetical protein